MSEQEGDRDIGALRQPMVTSIGLVMGFILNFLAGWATEDEAGRTIATLADAAVAFALLASIALMCLVLFRLLDIRQTDYLAVQRYHATFRIYRIAIILAFAGVGAALFL